jgi:hypothetical protein
MLSMPAHIPRDHHPQRSLSEHATTRMYLMKHCLFPFASTNLPGPQFSSSKLSSALRARWTAVEPSTPLTPNSGRRTRRMQSVSPGCIFYLAPPPSATRKAWKLAALGVQGAVFPVEALGSLSHNKISATQSVRYLTIRRFAHSGFGEELNPGA